MTPRTLVFVTAALAACAENGTLLPSDVTPAQDVGLDADDAPDVFDAAGFEIPRFDIPTAQDVTDAASDIRDVSDATDASDASDASDADDAPARRVDHCYLLDPRVMDLAPGATSPALGVAVFVSGVTSGAGRGAMVTVEVGYGPGGSQPLAATSTWTWAAASYDRDIDGRGATGARDYDRYQGTFAAPATADEYGVAARARFGAGPWTACDFVDATPHEYSPVQAARLTVAPAAARRVGYCNLQYPRTLSLASGATAAAPVYGRAFATGVTNRGCTDVPAATELTAQWGYGPGGSFPSGATWTWVDGRYVDHRDTTMPLGTGNCQSVEYQATPRAPSDCAPRAYGWRVRLGAGPWTYCRWAPPADGAPTTPAFDVWDPTLAGAMTVTGCL